MLSRVMTGFALIGALVVAAPPQSLGDINRGPYLQNVRQNAITIAFEGNGFSGPEVAFGTDDTGQFTEACQCQGVHCVCEISDLAPDTTYLYLIENGGQAASPQGTFRTAPDWARPFSFVVYGDNRSDHDSHSKVVGNILGETHELLMNTGDAVSSGEIEEDWDMFFQIENPLLLHKPFHLAVGNHEEDEGKVEIVDRLLHPPYVESNSPEKTYYSFDYSNVHFIVIDGFVNVEPWYLCLLQGKFYDNCHTAEQTNWIEIDLNKAAADPAIDHVFVFAHEGPYSSKEGRTGSGAMRDLMPIFVKSKVKVVFSGHDHYFEHGKSGNGVDYIISGGGGAPLYETAPGLLNQMFPHEVFISESIHNYQVVEVEGAFVKVTTFDVDAQNVIEEFEIGDKPDCTVPADCEGEQTGTCEGWWECADFSCIWTCKPAKDCETAADCGDPPENSCEGSWECTIFGDCAWMCTPTFECEADEDCSDKDPLTDCEGGTFECTEGVCEWVCGVQPECEFAYHCVGKEPLTDCVGGFYQCADGLCVWQCPPEGVEPDILTPGEDAASAVAEEEDLVAQPGELGSTPVEPSGPSHPVPTGNKDGGCSFSESPASPFALLLLLLTLLALAVPSFILARNRQGV